MKKLFILFIAVAGFGVSSFGQLEATGTATAKIITPLTLTSSTPMDFGNIAASGAPGTIVLTPAGIATSSGGATIPAAGAGSPLAATFVLSGDGDNTFSILLPTTHAVRIGLTGAVMDIDSFTSDPDGTGTLEVGVATVNVGATLNVAANQATGTYTSVGTFAVTFAYN